MPYPLTYRLAVQDRRAARQALVQADKSLAALMNAKRDLEERINDATVRQRVADKMFTEIERQLDMLLSNKTSVQKALLHNALQAMWRAQEKMDNRSNDDYSNVYDGFFNARHAFLMIHRETAAPGDVVFNEYDDDNHPTFSIMSE
jgi:hypothetical protein